VPDLVEKRRVFLKGGWAYVPTREQSSLVFQEFEDHLEKALEARFSYSFQLHLNDLLFFVDHSTTATSVR
jgi:DNA primase large subunit